MKYDTMEDADNEIDRIIDNYNARRLGQQNMGNEQPTSLRQAVQNFAARNQGKGLKDLQFRDRRR